MSIRSIAITTLSAVSVVVGAKIMKEAVNENTEYDDIVFKMGAGLCLIGTGSILNRCDLIGDETAKILKYSSITLCIINPLLSDLMIQLRRLRGQIIVNAAHANPANIPVWYNPHIGNDPVNVFNGHAQGWGAAVPDQNEE
jgi:hypothetical protein